MAKDTIKCLFLREDITLITLRDYQTNAINAIVEKVEQNQNFLLIELATGAGKSIIVSSLAEYFSNKKPSQKVLCLAPRKELIEQNYEKYLLLGKQASIFCAAANKKSLEEQVVFASPMTSFNSLEQIEKIEFSAIIIDEAHNLTTTIKEIVKTTIEKNPSCKIIGMTATPYRTIEGYIYKFDEQEQYYVERKEGREPYFEKLVYKMRANELIEQGYLSNVILSKSKERYETEKLEMAKNKKYTPESIKYVFEDDYSKTARIVNDVVERSAGRKGVMFFCASIKHAEQVLDILVDAYLITGETKKAERQRILKAFKAQKFKYLVNVDVLTTGFDAPHVDVIAVLRATESKGLFQQIIGRGTRLSPDKVDCMLLDYGQNIINHGLEEDLFSPLILAQGKNSDVKISIECPICKAVTTRRKRIYKELDKCNVDKNGFYLEVDEIPEQLKASLTDEQKELKRLTIKTSKGDEFIPAHTMLRCINDDCTYMYPYKKCKKCNAILDLLAKSCKHCNSSERIGYEDKLSQIAYGSEILNEDNTFSVWRTFAEYKAYESNAGNKTLKMIINTNKGEVVTYISKKMPWIFDVLCELNNTTSDEISDDYIECESWDKFPSKITVYRKYDSFVRREILKLKNILF